MKKQFNLFHTHVDSIKQFDNVDANQIAREKVFQSTREQLKSQHLENETFNRIAQIIHKKYQFKIKYRNFSSRRTFIERRTHQIERFFMYFDVIELKVRDFDRVTRFKNVEVFNITFREIDVFLELSFFKFFNFVSRSMNVIIVCLNRDNSSFYVRIKFNIYDRDHRLIFYRMKNEFHLIVFTTQKNFEIYRQSKNVDFVLLLLEKYHEFLNICSRKKVDILFKHESHDHVIHFQKNKRFLIFVLYDMSYNEILKFRRYLNENFNKKYIRVNRFDAIVSILFVKKLKRNFDFA